MKVIYLKNFDEVVKIENLSLVLGNFDGVHIGHSQLIKYAQQNCGGKVGVFTFDKPIKSEKEYLTSIDDKIKLFEELGVDLFDIIQALDSLREPVSMFEPIYSDGGDTIYLADQIEDKQTNSNRISMKVALDEAINALEEREQFILDERFVVGKTQMEIAEQLQISQAQVSRIEKGAIKQLKKVLR